MNPNPKAQMAATWQSKGLVAHPMHHIGASESQPGQHHRSITESALQPLVQTNGQQVVRQVGFQFMRQSSLIQVRMREGILIHSCPCQSS